MDPTELLPLLRAAADAVRHALAGQQEWGLAGTHPGQYHSDVVADRAATAVLARAGVGIVSEESGRRDTDHDVVVVVDPLDGSTNASRGISWWNTSLCAITGGEAVAAVVHDLRHDRRYEAVRGEGATRDGQRLRASGAEHLADAMVGLNGFPRAHFGWRQFRALGAAALDLCAVAEGSLDGYVDCHADEHGVWDYLGGMVIAREAGAVVGDAFGRELVVLDPDERRTPVAAASQPLFDELLAARVAAGPPVDQP